jgi:hypothetical protein
VITWRACSGSADVSEFSWFAIVDGSAKSLEVDTTAISAGKMARKA